MTDALELSSVTVRAGSSVLLDEVSLRLDRGQFIALVGPNGAGKSLLIRTALGLLRPVSGEVTLAGRPVRALSGRQRAARLAWLPQEALPEDPLRSVEVVTAARFRFDEPLAESRRAAGVALAAVKAEKLSERLVSTLSGGERQRVALAATLTQEAPLLLLDEPANHLDPVQQMAMYQLIGSLWQEGHGVLCVTHDVNLLGHLAAGDALEQCQVVGLAAGKIRFRTSLRAAELPDRLSQLFGVRFIELRADEHSYFVVRKAPRLQ
ncbi:MAG: ABC transporter ATP-binding protein [Proteobacteria bacterium]|nr:ABC transporter ATP-binding protein [Pseudomonadota bacterium]